MNVLIRHYFHVDPHELNDELWAELCGDVAWLLKFQEEHYAKIINRAFTGKK